MNKPPWSRRSFVKAVGLAAVPALGVVPGLVKAGLPAAPLSGSAGSLDQNWSDLWPEARTAIDLYRKHLPADLNLGTPTSTTADEAGAMIRGVNIPIVHGKSQVGTLALDATFGMDQSRTFLWQSTKVAGSWYQASITNAFKAGDVPALNVA